VAELGCNAPSSLHVPSRSIRPSRHERKLGFHIGARSATKLAATEVSLAR
jgi:hypothetical protein